MCSCNSRLSRPETALPCSNQSTSGCCQTCLECKCVASVASGRQDPGWAACEGPSCDTGQGLRAWHVRQGGVEDVALQTTSSYHIAVGAVDARCGVKWIHQALSINKVKLS